MDLFRYGFWNRDWSGIREYQHPNMFRKSFRWSKKIAKKFIIDMIHSVKWNSKKKLLQISRNSEENLRIHNQATDAPSHQPIISNQSYAATL